ncbi:MAG: N5-glutamine methyltransferase family protein [Slackia sp.]
MGFERKGDEHARLLGRRVLSEATGLRRIDLRQFRAPALHGGTRCFARFCHVALRASLSNTSRRGCVSVISPSRFARASQYPGDRGVCERGAGASSGARTSLARWIRFHAGARRALAPKEEADEGQEAKGGEEPAPALDSSCAPLVADLCTGSGGIACSIAYERPRARVVATDLAPEAVALARENAVALGLEDRVRVLECNLADAIPDRLNGSFDLVVSNPPYIPDAVMEKLPDEVSDFEPRLALAGGPDGLDIFRKMLPIMHRLLRVGRRVCLRAARGMPRRCGDSCARCWL